jgi:hypothetical protein
MARSYYENEVDYRDGISTEEDPYAAYGSDYDDFGESSDSFANSYAKKSGYGDSYSDY